MRCLILFLLLLPVSFALIVESTGLSGSNPVVYGDIFAYERDGFIRFFDLNRDEDVVLSRGSDPSLFGFVVAFELDESDVDLSNDGDLNDTVIQFVNVRDKNVVNTGFVGRNPFIYSDVIVFSSSESDLGVDFTNDGDLSDDIIQYYTIKTGKTVNTKIAGDNPVANPKYFVFSVPESQVGVDLNVDGDKSDVVLRVYNREARSLVNVPELSSEHDISKEGLVVFLSNGELTLLDAREAKVLYTIDAGSSPSISGDSVVFVKDGSLFGFNLKSKSVAKLDILGDDVSLFERNLVFTSSESVVGDLNEDGDQSDSIIRFARAEESDGDDVFDFTDNCIFVRNEDQLDSDGDGVGDVCEKSVVVKSGEKRSETGSDVVNESSSERLSDESGFSWWWFLLLVLLLPFIVKFGLRYYKKRQKSFGF